MPTPIDVERVRSWIDTDLVENVDRIEDDAAEFNFTVEMSNIVLHVLRRRPDGPLLIGQQIEYGEGIRSRIRGLSDADRSELVTRIRETLATAPVIYGFHDEAGANVRFEEVVRIFIECRVYPDGVSQDRVMTRLVDVWKAMRYLDDVESVIDSVESR